MTEPAPNIRAVLHQMLSQDIQLWFDGDELHYKTPGEALTVQQRETLREYKTALREMVGQGRKYARASSAQKRLWFFHQYDPESPAYNLSALSLRIAGPLDIEALKLALAVLVRRHEALRTSFEVIEGEPFQVVSTSITVPLQVEDLTGIPEAEREAAAMQRCVEEVRAPFDLANGPLLRARLFCLRQERLADSVAQHMLVVPIHHIITDGWSIGIMLRELFEFYDAYSNERSSPLAEVPVQYTDYTLWQKHQLGQELLEAQTESWREKLSGAKPLLTFLPDHERPLIPTTEGRELEFEFSAALASQLKQLAHQAGVSLFMVLLAGFKALVHRYTGETDIFIGSGTANRRRPELTGVVGFFVNTLVLRTSLEGRPTFRELLRRVKEVSLDAYEHQDLPFEQVVQIVRPQRDLRQAPLFQLAFILQNLPAPDLQLEQLSVKRIHIDPGVAQFDLMMAVEETAHGLSGTVQYSTDLYEPGTIAQIVTHYRRLLEEAAQHPDVPLGDLATLAPEEAGCLTGAPAYTALTNIKQLLELQAGTTPELIAVCDAHASISYRRLHEDANRLARLLVDQGVGHETMLGVSLERGIAQITSVLAVFKAGATFVPLDPGYPPSRLQYMLQDAAVELVLVDAASASAIRAAAPSVKLLDLSTHSTEDYPAGPLPDTATPESLAYVIYTSGSTGVPKGTLIEHRGLPNLVHWQRSFFEIGPGQRVLQFAPMSFDAFLWETLPVLGSGATLCCPPAAGLVPRTTLADSLRRYEVSMVTLPPSALAELPAQDLPALQKIIVGGEACNAALIERWAGRVRFYNAYGPTEATICCAATDAVDPTRPRVIGRPVNGCRLHVLDAHRRPVPRGVPGELYISGPVLARGYLNQPEQTAAAFVTLTTPDGHSERAYKTGDLVRVLQDGNLDFIGRNDDQVKIRGCRIEPGEVEAVLRQHPAVIDAVVLVAEDPSGQPRLAAFVVPPQGMAPDTAELYRHLRTRLPQHMSPAGIRVLDALPTTPNGKIDRARLLDETGPLELAPHLFEAPHAGLEEQVAALLSTLLGVERVGRHDDFFRLGGHSLLAAQLLSRVYDTFGAKLSLRALFEQPTVAAIAAGIQAAQAPAVQALAEEQIDAMSDQELDTMLASLLSTGGERRG